MGAPGALQHGEEDELVARRAANWPRNYVSARSGNVHLSGLVSAGK